MSLALLLDELLLEWKPFEAKALPAQITSVRSEVVFIVGYSDVALLVML